MLERIKIIDPESAAAIEEFFDGMELPVPQNDEYYYDFYSEKNLTFVTDHGFVIRATHKSYLLEEESPHFILPLFNRAAGDYVINIDPGYDRVETKKEASLIYLLLQEKYGLVDTDGKPENLCFVPGTKYPVIIDLDPKYVKIDEGDISSLTRDVEDVKLYLHEENPQIEIYAPLRGIINAAWPAECSAPDPEGIKKFKTMCKDFKGAGKLVTPWVNEENDYHGTTDAAYNYAQRLVIR